MDAVMSFPAAFNMFDASPLTEPFCVKLLMRFGTTFLFNVVTFFTEHMNCSADGLGLRWEGFCTDRLTNF